MKMIKQFDFEVRQKRLENGTFPEAIRFSVVMTQEQFENYQTQREFVDQSILACGLNPSEVDWYETPAIDTETEEAFKAAIGAKPDADLIAYYPHSYYHKNYKEVTVNGAKFLYRDFQNGQFIKFAQSLSNA